MIALAAITALLTLLVLAPPRRNAIAMGLTFFLVLAIAEFVPLLVLAQAALLYRYWDPTLLPAFVLCWTLLLWAYFAPGVLGSPLAYLQPFPLRRKGVHTRSAVFDKEHGLHVSVYSRKEAKQATAIVYVHGGGWIVGHRLFQGRPFLLHMAERGYVCFSIDYRLSPRATFPAHIIDVKRALAWVREHAAEYGVDPDRIVIAGNSAGGHLAALAALSPGAAEWQPGFENARTDVMACLCFYGIYDLEDSKTRWRSSGLEWLWRFLVIQQRRADAPLLWQSASPVFHLKQGAPPFLLVHGTHDTLVPVQEARAFKKRLEGITRVELLEVRGGQHAFELGISPRARVAVAAAEKFLATL